MSLETSFFDGTLFSYVLLPLLIFLARIADVSLGTLRIIMLSKGKKTIAPILGFFEVLIWIVAISKIIQNLDNVVNYIAYAAGFAAGNYVGMIIEEKLAMGVMIVRVITSRETPKLITNLQSKGYGLTVVDAQGSKEKVNVIYTVIQRQNLQDVINIIQKHNPKAFYSVEDVRLINEGIFPHAKEILGRKPGGSIFRRWRKGK